MIPQKTIEELINKHSDLEKDLSMGNVDKKVFADKSKEYSDLNEIIEDAKKYISFDNDKLELEKIVHSFAAKKFLNSYLIKEGVEEEKLNREVLKVVDVRYGKPYEEETTKEYDNFIFKLIPGSKDEIKKINQEFQNRKNFVHKKLNELENMDCFEPGGAFYAFPNISLSGYNGQKFSDIALEEKGVALVPGTSFGYNAKNFVRISYANSMENLEKAIYRLSTI